MGAIKGKQVQLHYIAGQDNRAKVNGVLPKPVGTYLALGASRGYSEENGWETVDTTTRDTPGNMKTSDVTFLSTSGSVSGLYRSDDLDNIKALRAHVKSPQNGGPFAWIKSTLPDGDTGAKDVEETYVLITNFSYELPYDDVGTYSFDYEAQEPSIPTSVPAV